jgi:hypothetical protein
MDYYIIELDLEIPNQTMWSNIERGVEVSDVQVYYLKDF